MNNTNETNNLNAMNDLNDATDLINTTHSNTPNTPNTPNKLIDFLNNFEIKNMISDIESVGNESCVDSTQKIFEIDFSENHEERLNDMLAKTKKYAATADNLENLSRFKKKEISQFIHSRYKNYFQEYSMTRFKNSNITVLKRLKHMQTKYNSILEHLNIFEKMSLNNRKKYISNSISSITEKIHLNMKVKIGGKSILYIKHVIFIIEKNLKNIFMKEEIFNSNNVAPARKSAYTITNLELMISDKIMGFKKNDINISYIIDSCNFFVEYERILHENMNITILYEDLLLLKIKEELSKLKECVKKNIFYEISKFIELYEQNLEFHIKKRHFYSTIFLLSALVIKFDNINKLESTSGSEENIDASSSDIIALDVFLIGAIFEKLLRNLNNHDMKANCYGMLNTCRLFLNFINYRNKKRTLLFLQIPCFIAMVIDEAFEFDEIQFKEFLAFNLFLMKETSYANHDFLNDKIQYFWEINASVIDNIIIHNLFIVGKAKIISKKNSRLDILAKNLRDFLNSSVSSEKNMPFKCLQLKKLYVSQLYRMLILKERCILYQIEDSTSYRFFPRYEKKINELFL
ncbi:hypothetical protein CWI36_0125p0030 [Hamiltosporidium magnivora]|uniref:Uncharacterized protein n=1 Tax=Hamiltosporidium magnivora TaxID=148818 RepID=A0A4Q9LJZ7_9MICR|nr:hypothetical protein CWI36_0125p0030 [Hamiltosporidium magnivora]